MKKWLLIIAALAVPHMAAAVNDTFATGDYVFVKARVLGCGSQVRYLEAAQVDDAGYVTLFRDIQLGANNKTAGEIGAQLTDSLERRTGHRPKTIEIVKVPADDPRKAALLMMWIHDERSRDCEMEEHRQNVPGWIGEFQIA